MPHYIYLIFVLLSFDKFVTCGMIKYSGIIHHSISINHLIRKRLGTCSDDATRGVSFRQIRLK